MTKKPAMSEFRLDQRPLPAWWPRMTRTAVAAEALDLDRPLVRSRDTMNGRPDGSASTRHCDTRPATFKRLDAMRILQSVIVV
jgi:hypothetical protein